MKKLYQFWLLFFSFTMPMAVMADAKLNEAVKDTPLAERGDIYKIIGEAVQFFIGLLGIIFVILVIYAGFLRMTAGGEADKIKKSNHTMMAAVAGLILTLSAYIIVRFILVDALGL